MKDIFENPWHSLGLPETYSTLESNIEGLASSEAQSRLEKYGYNELEGEDSISPWRLLLEQFKNVLIIVLLIAVAISISVEILNRTYEFLDAIVIFIIVLFAAGLGFIQEYRASKAIQALKRMAAPLASVLRDGAEAEVPSREVVPGDVVIIRTGDKIPADARIIESFNLRTDEAALTGESMPVEKISDSVNADSGLGDRLNMLFSGTAAVYGRCKAVVVGTGQHTEFGKIAAMLKEVKQDKTPLQINLDRIGKWIAIAALILCFILALMGVFRGHEPLEMLIWGISLAVAAVPEALPAVVTISLALGVNRMVKMHALIRKLPAVETLGCTTIICSDKTGTMTQDQMTLKKIYTGGKLIDITGVGYEPAGDFLLDGNIIDHDSNADLQKLLISANMCSDTALVNIDGQWKIQGDPTEGAFVVAAVKAGINIEQSCGIHPRVGEIPFSSESKRMTTIYREPDGVIAYSNGAAEVILSTCEYVYMSGSEEKLDESGREKIQKIIRDMANDALRVLATSYKRLPDNFTVDESVNSEMVLMGLGGMIDPPRPEVKSSIQTCVDAGIKTVMITGDHKITAVAIARELGILKKGLAVTGSELNAMTPNDFHSKVEDIEVYARVSPEHKLRVVDALTRKNHVVAMTGDGINDAPALKKADIGVAMGIKGTDVTKESADMILTDDNFASLVTAVAEGRNIFENIKKFLMYLLSSNIGEILLMAGAVLFGPLIGLPYGAIPLIAIQILYVNLATDGLPAIALSVDPPDPDIMTRRPRPKNQNIFTLPVALLMAVGGIWSCLVNIFIFKSSLDAGRTMLEAQALCFMTLILIQFFKAYNFRSDRKSIFKIGIFTNKWLNLAILWETALLVIIFCVPVLQDAFHTFTLSIKDWVEVILLSLSIFPVLEITKWIIRSQKKWKSM
ncbi:MAG: cation-translocating P-type ATPase [Dehalococcoidia bacterium]|nr:cation-translocating P-type ATPase [Dehalococcoidia bacterium]